MTSTIVYMQDLRARRLVFAYSQYLHFSCFVTAVRNHLFLQFCSHECQITLLCPCAIQPQWSFTHAPYIVRECITYHCTLPYSIRMYKLNEVLPQPWVRFILKAKFQHPIDMHTDFSRHTSHFNCSY